MNKVEYYKVYRKFELFDGVRNDVRIDIICQTEDFTEATICHQKLIQEFYNSCSGNIDNKNIEFCTDVLNEKRPNKEIPFSEITSLFDNCGYRWWHKPIMEKVSVEFFNKLKDDAK